MPAGPYVVMMGKGSLQRSSGAFVAAVTLATAALLWFALAAAEKDDEGPSEGVIFGVWHVFYDVQVPAVGVLVAAVAVALLAAAGLAFLEWRIATLSRRSTNLRGTPLAPRVLMRETRGVFAGPVTVTVLVPAHNEEASLPATLASLRSQTRPPERVIVVADNCTDTTVALAEAAGVEVVESIENRQKKAGALNQVLADLLPALGDNDVVMVMDADTRLSEEFLSVAVRHFTDDRALMAVGGLFHGEHGHGLIGQLQRNEYVRYEREVRRRRGRVFVLTGTASLFRSRALRTVAESRGHAIPGTNGRVYDTAALTEDNELTIAIKSLGGLMVSPRECTVVTELMPTWRTLWAQRLRWQRGALENLGAYGMTRQTFRYWAQQLGIGYGVIALSSFMLMMLVMALALDHWVWFPFWMGLGAVFIAERLVTAWSAGVRGRLLAIPLLPELMFDLFLDAVYIKGVVDISFGRTATWKHVAPEAPLPTEMAAP
jgi:cellulose synthase/poly-beta-1,6-N-acetylglucosamine synthase-like glycosyltransferase